MWKRRSVEAAEAALKVEAQAAEAERGSGGGSVEAAEAAWKRGGGSVEAAERGSGRDGSGAKMVWKRRSVEAAEAALKVEAQALRGVGTWRNMDLRKTRVIIRLEEEAEEEARSLSKCRTRMSTSAFLPISRLFSRWRRCRARQTRRLRHMLHSRR